MAIYNKVVIIHDTHVITIHDKLPKDLVVIPVPENIDLTVRYIIHNDNQDIIIVNNYIKYLWYFNFFHLIFNYFLLKLCFHLSFKLNSSFTLSLNYLFFKLQFEGFLKYGETYRLYLKDEGLFNSFYNFLIYRVPSNPIWRECGLKILRYYLTVFSSVLHLQFFLTYLYPIPCHRCNVDNLFHINLFPLIYN